MTEKKGLQIRCYTCVNCGHPVTNVANLILHIQKDSDNWYESSKICGQIIENVDVNWFIWNENKELQRHVDEQFDGKYSLWYWFDELHCNCTKPEVNKESKRILL